MVLEKNSRLVMAGDSVTDSGRNYTFPPCSWGTWGDGYVHLVYSALLDFAADKNIMVINQGVSGNTSEDLKNRWEADIMSLKPDYVSVMIGINDVWRHFDSVVRQETLIGPKQFKSNYCEIMDKTLPAVKHMFLMTPAMFEINKSEPMFQKKKEYDCLILEVAQEYNQTFVDVQSYVDKVLEHQHPYMFTMDRVHPNLPGHMILAKAFLDAIGLNTSVLSKGR